MMPLIEENLEAIRALAHEFGVMRVEVFGSAATGAFDPGRSHVDFIVDYPLDYEFGLWLGRYFELKERLEALLGRPGRPGDGWRDAEAAVHRVGQREPAVAVCGVTPRGCWKTSSRRRRTSRTTPPV